ncbi:hypothetical protein TorRG33x02_236970, partial [Trema orientale]
MDRPKRRRQSAARVVPSEPLFDVSRAINIVIFNIRVPNWSDRQTLRQSIVGDMLPPVMNF